MISKRIMKTLEKKITHGVCVCECCGDADPDLLGKSLVRSARAVKRVCQLFLAEMLCGWQGLKLFGFFN